MVIQCKRFVALIASGVTLCLPAVAGDMVILESTSVRYQAGQIITDSTVISLTEGETLEIVGEDGSFFKLTGPLDGIPTPVAADKPDVLAAVKRMIATDQASASGLGAVRGSADSEAAVADTRPSPWYFHVEHAGDQCFSRGTEMSLWRENGESSQEFEVLNLSTGQKVVMEWPAGSQTLGWPPELETGNGEIFLMRPVDQIQSTQIVAIELADTAAATNESAMVWLAAKGCVRQAEIVMATL